MYLIVPKIRYSFDHILPLAKLVKFFFRRCTEMNKKTIIFFLIFVKFKFKLSFFFLNFFFGVPHSATFILVIFVCLCNSQHRLHPSSIRCRGSNPRSIDNEPSAFTTRPWLSPYSSFLIFQSPEPKSSKIPKRLTN